MNLKEFGVWVFGIAAGAVFLCSVAAGARSCNDSDNRVYEACIKSQRSAMDCALIVRGTK